MQGSTQRPLHDKHSTRPNDCNQIPPAGLAAHGPYQPSCNPLERSMSMDRRDRAGKPGTQNTVDTKHR